MPALAGRVDLALLDLDAEVDAVKRRERELHPHVLAVLQQLVLVSSRRDPQEPKLTEHREQDLLGYLVLGRRVEEAAQPVALRTLVSRERAVRVDRHRGSGSRGDM